MDEKCREIINEMKLSNVVVISLQEFEDEEMLQIKEVRSRAEYCWTCTASLIDYVFETYKEKYCTYIDSDLCFYKNPRILIEEMLNADCSVQIVEHGFGKGMIAREKVKGAGRYCVQFNTFKNDVNSRLNTFLGDIDNFKSDVNSNINNFKGDVNTSISSFS